MELNQYKALIAMARANIPQDLLKDILVPAIGLDDTDNYWHQVTAHLALAVAQHQVNMGDMRAERLQGTLAGLTTQNVLENLDGQQRDYYSRMESRQLNSTVACVHSLFRKSYPMAARPVAA